MSDCTRLQLEILDTIEAVRSMLGAMSMGEWNLTEETLEHSSGMLHRSALKLRAQRFVGGTP